MSPSPSSPPDTTYGVWRHSRAVWDTPYQAAMMASRPRNGSAVPAICSHLSTGIPARRRSFEAAAAKRSSPSTPVDPGASVGTSIGGSLVIVMSSPFERAARRRERRPDRPLPDGLEARSHETRAHDADEHPPERHPVRDRRRLLKGRPALDRRVGGRRRAGLAEG